MRREDALPAARARGRSAPRPSGTGAGGASGGERTEAGGGACWFAVFTRPRAEETARDHLACQGFETFLPLRLRTVRHARRAEERAVPLFPRYLFVRFDPAATRWRGIESTRGVKGLVRFAEEPAPVPEAVVAGLRATSDDSGIVDFERALSPGQAVRLAAGPFAETIGILERLEGADAVRVLVDVMGRATRLRARRRQVLPAEPAA